jgi:hypothetical protein
LAVQQVSSGYFVLFPASIIPLILHTHI